MTLKANRPWFELTILGVLIYGTGKFLLLAIEKWDPPIILPISFLVLMGLFVTTWTNKEYRSYVLGDKLSFKGKFWGQGFLDLKELTGFKIKERKNTNTPLFPISEYDIIIFTLQNKNLTIRQDNYNPDDINKFKELLELSGIPFFGTEKFSWTKSFKNLLRLKFFD